MRQSEHGGDATPGERQQVVDLKLFDQLQQDDGFIFLADRPAMAVVRLGLAGVGLIVKHHIELWLQVLDGLRKGGGGGQRAVDQDDGLARAGVGIELRVYLERPVYIDDSDGWLHVVSSWRKNGHGKTAVPLSRAKQDSQESAWT